jgi:predicted transcriptional regulator
MELLWAHGESSVHGVVERLGRSLAYTTVMTTLDRLFKKGLLERRKAERAYLYAARWTRQEWQHLLISSLVEAVGEYDTALLNELEKKIREKREELDRRGKT